MAFNKNLWTESEYMGTYMASISNCDYCSTIK